MPRKFATQLIILPQSSRELATKKPATNTYVFKMYVNIKNHILKTDCKHSVKPHSLAVRNMEYSKTVHTFKAMETVKLTM